MGWIYLIVAGFFEIAWAIGLKFTHSFSRLWPTVGVVITMILSVYFLSLAIKSIPVGTAYAVWTGIGIAGTSVLGILLFNESASVARILLILLIFLSIIGLKLIPQ
ncbi:MAG: multidrug efflux SMR transporter [Bacteroidales bacterium]|nr:multidrug efflux SMR transporter [Bacteroidales bacterium]MBS3774172.1 multidrug efflux SMR transporter [Bacteroidales bacterium]